MLRVLDTHHILSAPVFAANSSRCVGWISVGDVLRAILGWAALMDDPSPAGRVENLRRAGARLETSRVRDIARANDGSLLLAASEGISLLDVVRDGLLRGSGGCGEGVPPCHRVGVYDFEGGADLIAFGRPYITNPDLVERFTNGWPLNDFSDMSGWYSFGPEGYVDYPAYQAA